MDINNLLTGLPLGALLGVLLKYFLDLVTNKPKPKFNQREILLDRFYENQLKDGSMDKRSVSIESASHIKINAQIIAANAGNLNTAYSDVSLEIRNKTRKATYYTDFLFKVDNEELPKVFNLEANSCKVIDIICTLQRDSKEIFEDIFADEEQLSITLLLTNIKGRTKKIKLDIKGGWTAIDEYPF